MTQAILAYFASGVRQVTRSSDVVFVIPARKNLLYLVFAAVWLLSWSFGGRDVARMMQGRGELGPEIPFNDLETLMWLIIWLIVFLSLIWQLFGKETIVIDADGIVITDELFVVLSTQEYDAKFVKVASTIPLEDNPPAWALDLSGAIIGKPKLRFAVDGEWVLFGKGLDPFEARQILQSMQRKIPGAFNADGPFMHGG